ncbi:elongin-C-like [Paramacrobiotus metropolitanus]|uniref:elongin-C-like n=1 Tax=Paramacrobiotus metropolitanus TaxID=2943436 RepID=UPI002445992B|nr:elongin-C-like [Paramacrobiotus metropolitanus]
MTSSNATTGVQLPAQGQAAVNPAQSTHPAVPTIDRADGRTPVTGVTGIQSDYVVLVSSDFHEFIITRSAAYMSATIRRMLEGRNKEISPWNVNEVLVNYPSMIVSKVAEYMIYKEYYERTHEDAPGFTVPPAIVLEVLMAAQFLDI